MLKEYGENCIAGNERAGIQVPPEAILEREHLCVVDRWKLFQQRDGRS